eukprot:CAMPEP_0116854202 /NCGR_PEP_ID=MMETSP0418-20121206/18435_1 /TAXON_ID=1158023 /ORGANISM="Astrosyne radiata, Strain 13vi08-1A" /LENGTH=214 /DNA_ID=CAMNT_0004486885 /DNA_START=94 /DNA_END=738 /DNA_ORIENTATION=+
MGNARSSSLSTTLSPSCLCRNGVLDAVVLSSTSQQQQQQMEKERKEGQELLRTMVTCPTDQIDWEAVIAKANELHQREQEHLRRSTGRRARRIWIRSQRRALARRKRYDTIGSFSVNMLTYRMGESFDDYDYELKNQGRDGILKINKTHTAATRSMGSEEDSVESEHRHNHHHHHVHSTGTPQTQASSPTKICHIRMGSEGMEAIAEDWETGSI